MGKLCVGLSYFFKKMEPMEELSEKSENQGV